MEHQTSKNYLLPNRFGFHYFPDFLHFTEKDTHLWLPVLKELKAQWLAITSPMDRAVPEEFIRAVVNEGITLVANFDDILRDSIDWNDLELLITSYGKWGVKFAVFGCNPNQQHSWARNQWGKSDLIHEFSQNFLHFSDLCLENSIRPVFPMLTPGGDYWDLAFLKLALNQIKDNGSQIVQNNFILSAAAWDWGRHLDWGAGGPQKWPHVKPYKLPQKSQNHLGFRIYEWYSAIAQDIFDRNIPILLQQAGLNRDEFLKDEKKVPSDLNNILTIFRLLKEENVYDALDEANLLHPIGAEVIGCVFYLLASSSVNPQVCQWYSTDGGRLPPAQSVFISGRLNGEEKSKSDIDAPPTVKTFQHNRYVLISRDLESDTAQLLEMLHPYIEKFRPMIGYSVEEAKSSALILAITPFAESKPSKFEMLRTNGSLVRVIWPSEITNFIKEQIYATQ